MSNPQGINQYTKGGMGRSASKATKSRLDLLQKQIRAGDNPQQRAESARQNKSGAVANKHRAARFK